jgi:hypothetical protein
MGGQQKNFISDIEFFQHQDGMRKKVRRHFLQCVSARRVFKLMSSCSEVRHSSKELASLLRLAAASFSTEFPPVPH